LSGVKGGLKERLPKVHEMVGTHGRGGGPLYKK
jgi:hypothetical protein